MNQAEKNRRRRKRRKQAMIARMVVGVGLVALMVLLIVLLVNLLKKKPGESGPIDIGQSSFSSQEKPDLSKPLESSEPESSESSENPSVPESSEVPTSSEETPASTQQGAAGIEKSDVQKVNGTWDLMSLNNTERSFGYSEANRAANMVPTDWKFYENKWGQYAVDWLQDTNSNTIYLTMDVGFANDYTEGIIDTLKEKNVKVVFFITKMFFDSSPDTVQRMLDEGHIVGDHTCTHPNMPSLELEKATAEIMDLKNAMYKKFNYEMKLFRFPEGRFSDRMLALVENCGMKSVFWSYAYNDYSTKQPEVQPSYEKAVSYLHPGAIYLLHASSSTNAAFLGDWIDAAREKGYEFGVYPID